MQYGFKLVPVTIRDVSLHLIASKLGLPIFSYLFPAMYAISRCDSISSFSQTGNMTTFQTLKNKQNQLELTDMIDFGEFPSFSYESPSVVTQLNMYVIFMIIISQRQV